MKVFLKVLILGLVSCATWLATATIMAQYQNRKVSARPVPLTSVSTIQTLSTTPPAIPIELGKSGAFAEAHLRSFKITVDKGVATVNAHVSLADQRKGMSYIWRLRVVDFREAPIAGRVYDQQIFSVEVNGQKEATFHDVIEVPFGARRVELVLYEKAQGNDLSFLNDDSTARGHEMIRVVQLQKH